MSDVILRIGQGIRLAVEGSLTYGELEGTILMAGKKDLMLSFQRYRDLPGVRQGAQAVLSLWDDFGLHQGKSRVVTVTPQPYPGLIIERPQDFLTRQKRGYFRVATSLAMNYSSELADALASTAITDDISAGGVRFRTLQPLPVGARLETSIDFPRGDQTLNYDVVSLQARVLRVTDLPIDEAIQRVVSCQFENVSQPERDRLVKLLLDLQRRAR
jgi:hypothetical protein